MDYRVINSPDGRAGKVHIAGNEAFPFTSSQSNRAQANALGPFEVVSFGI